MEYDYEGFIKGLISIEKDINDEDVLSQMYEEYMNSDITLLNEFFDDLEYDLRNIEKVNDIVSSDIIREDLPIENDIKGIVKDRISTKSLLGELKVNEDLSNLDKNVEV
ncbi:MAG TPA: hypothetical protein GX708_22520 [Gallicola sp.]|nr:hypothetical protein [Gallicola sp.]